MSHSQPARPSDRFGVIAVIQRNDRYLVLRRSLTESAPGKICFPGGGVETGETEHVALIREVEEEVGIANAEPIRRIYESYTNSGIRLGWWLTDIADDAVAVANPVEAQECFWWTEQQMRESGDLLRTNLEFLNAIAENRTLV